MCSEIGLTYVWCQAIIWTNAGLLFVVPTEKISMTNLIEIQEFFFTQKSIWKYRLQGDTLDGKVIQISHE